MTLLTCLIVVSMNGKKQNGAGENWTLIMTLIIFFLPTYRIYHKGYSDEGQRSRYTRKMAEGHSAILGKIHEPSLSCVLCYGRIATDYSSVRCRKSQMDKPKKRVTMPRYNGVTIKAIICPHPPPPPHPPLLSIVTEFEKPTNLVHPSRSNTNLLSTLFRLQNVGTCLGPFPHTKYRNGANARVHA